MAECMLPASPNWYCSRVLDTNDKGLACFGAKHSLYILDTVTNPPKFKGHIAAHQDRVVGLSFCMYGEQHRLCSIAEDGKAKIWDLTDKSLCGEHSEHKNKLTSVDWSRVDADLIVSGDEKGGLVTWRPASGDLKTFSPEPNSIFCLSCSLHSASLVAIGYKNGQVLVVDVSRKGGNIIVHKFRGHDDEIHSIVWSPQQEFGLRTKRRDWDKPEEEAEKCEEGEYLLASGSRDKTIRVWSLEHTKHLHFYKLSQPSGQRRGWDDSRQRVWVTLYWPKQRPREIVFSSFNGDLFLWDLARPGKPNPQQFTGSTFHTHTRIVFNITQAGLDGRGICSISMDRNLILWDAETLSVDHVIPSFGGFVYCLAQSPIHSGRIAAGVGDNLIRVWNVENTSRPHDVSVYWQGIKSKVTSVSWHPTKEGHLAFGTDDGKVGIMDILSSRSHGSSTYHKRTVYVVSWGPPSYAKDGSAPGVDYMLYSCGDCSVIQHNPVRLEDNAVDIANIIRQTNTIKGKLPGRSEISWKPDYTLLALGNEDGTIEIFKAPHLQLLCSVQVHRKLVNCVRWHPQYTPDHADPSKCQFWIASGSNEAVIQVTDLGKTLELMSGDSSTGAMVVTESFCQLEGHTNRITGLYWSPHTEGLLASASYDWTAQVWDVKKSEPVANYRSHHGRLLCTLWSALDPDLVYTGGDDFTIQGWKISQQPHKAPPAGSEKRKHKSRNKGAKLNIKHVPDANLAPNPAQLDSSSIENLKLSIGDPELAEIQAMLEKKTAELLISEEKVKECEVPAVLQSPEGAHLEPVASTHSYPKPIDSTPTKRDGTKKDLKDKTKRKVRSLFPLSSTMDNRGKLHTQDDCVNLIQAKAKESIPMLPEDQYHLGHFVDRKNAYKLFDEEISHHLDQGNWDQYMILETFRGNIGDGVRTMTEKRELSDLTVALSAMASPKVWRASCEAYAAQLEKEGNCPKAASYLLAVHKVYEAIDLLKRNGHYKDALCLARVRLSPEDPVIRSLYASWGNQLASDGNFELAAKCFIANDQPLEAARLLARRADVSALRVASEICISCQDMANAKVYCHKFVHQCMLNLDWAGAAKLVRMDNSLQLHGLLLSTHQGLLQQLHLLGYICDFDVDKGEQYTETCQATQNKPTLPWMMLKTSDMKSWLPWQPYTVEGEAFIHHLVRQWCDVWAVGMGRDSLEKLDQELTQLCHTRQTQTAIKQILVEITCHVTLVIIKLLLGNKEDAAHWMCIAMAMCHDNLLNDVWEGLCRLLLPTGGDGFGHLCQEVKALRLSVLAEPTVDIDQVITSVIETSDPDHTQQQGSDTVCNDGEQCSAMACLEAYYNLRVLKYYLDESERKNSSPGKMNSPTRQVHSKLDTNKAFVSCAQNISRSLLWNIQIQKLKLRETLAQISRATAVLVSQQGTGQSPGSATGTSSAQPCNSPPATGLRHDQAPSINCDVETPHVYPITPEIRHVSLAAFQKENQMIMSQMDKAASRSGPVLSPDNINTHTVSQQEAEEYVKMHSVTLQNGEETVSVTAATAMEGTSVDEDLKCTENVIINVPNEQSSTETADGAVTEQELENVKNSDFHRPFYPDIPEEWYDLPVHEKYCQSYVTMMVLIMERILIQNQLTQLQHNVKDIPFPDPEQSAILLMRLCRTHHQGAEQSVDVDHLAEAIRTWALQFCFSRKSLDFFTREPSR